MPFQCRLLEHPPKDEQGNLDIDQMQVGDMWFLDVPKEDYHRYHLSDYYFQHNSGRPPLMVILPGKYYHSLDGKCYNGSQGYYDGWQVSGTPPLITVAPSINAVGRYHGFLQNGIFTDNM